MLKSKKVEFTTAMDAEQKKAGNVEKVSFVVSFVDVDEETIRKHAIANCVVGWQSQIRNNWDKFIDGELPKVVTFGEPLFAPKRVKTVVKPASDADVQSMLQKALAIMDQKDIMEMASTGSIPQRILDRIK